MKAQGKKTHSTNIDGGRSPHQRLRKRVSIEFPRTSRTKQSFKEECDINNILAKYKEDGRLPDLIKQNPKYGDFSNPLSYQDSLNVVLIAEEQFSLLPAKIRDRFANDPKAFLEFTANPENLPEMVQLGLAEKRQTNQKNDDKQPLPKEPKIKETGKKADDSDA